MSRCNRCEKKTDDENLISVRKMGGGSYNRAPRRYRAHICAECAKELMASVTEGHYLHECYDVGSVRYGLMEWSKTP